MEAGVDTIRRLDTGRPLSADFNDPELVKFLLAYDKTTTRLIRRSKR